MSRNELSRRSVLRSVGASTGGLALPETALGDSDSSVPFDLDPTDEAYRKHRWTVRHGTDHVGESVYGDPEPIYRGSTNTQLRLLDVNWEDSLTPNPDTALTDSDGCWRYTFLLNSRALAMYPKRIESRPAADGGGYVITSDQWTLAKRGADFQPVMGTCDIGSKFGVHSPDPSEHEQKADNVAISVRRSPNLLKVSNPFGESFENCENDDGNTRRDRGVCAATTDDFGNGLAKLALSFGGVPGVSYANYRPLWDRIPIEKQDEPIVQSIAVMLATQFKDHALTDVEYRNVDLDGLNSRLGNFTGFVGDMFTGMKALLELVDGAPQVETPYYRGFEVDKSPDGRGPVSSHMAMVDLYVTPNADTHVTVFSGHEQEENWERGDWADNQYLNYTSWKVGLNPPGAPTSGNSPSMGRLFRSANPQASHFLGDEGRPDWDVPSEDDAPAPHSRTTTPVPMIRWQVDPVAEADSAVPVFDETDDLVLDAHESVGWRSAVREYNWRLKRSGQNLKGDQQWRHYDSYDQRGRDATYEISDLTPGLYRIDVTPVGETYGNQAHVAFRVRSVNERPTAEIASISDREPAFEDVVTFEGRGEDAESDVSMAWHTRYLEFDWPGPNVGWRARGTGFEAEHAFEKVGTHRIRLTVTDEAGNVRYDYATVEVSG